MKRLIRKADKEQQDYENEETYDNEEKEHDFEEDGDMEREDPYLGRYVEITNRRSKYYGHHAWVDDKFYTGRYKLYIEPQRYDDDKGKDYIINFVGELQAPKWFTVVQ